jgi:hypothetical protein
MNTPDTTAYFHAAYIVVLTLYALYGISLWWRTRNVTRSSGERS